MAQTCVREAQPESLSQFPLSEIAEPKTGPRCLDTAGALAATAECPRAWRFAAGGGCAVRVNRRERTRASANTRQVGSRAAGSSCGASESCAFGAQKTCTLQKPGRSGDAGCDLASPRPQPVRDSRCSRRRRRAACRVRAWLGPWRPSAASPSRCAQWGRPGPRAQRARIDGSRVSAHRTWYWLALPPTRSYMKGAT